MVNFSVSVSLGLIIISFLDLKKKIPFFFLLQLVKHCYLLLSSSLLHLSFVQIYSGLALIDTLQIFNVVI